MRSGTMQSGALGVQGNAWTDINLKMYADLPSRREVLALVLGLNLISAVNSVMIEVGWLQERLEVNSSESVIS